MSALISIPLFIAWVVLMLANLWVCAIIVFIPMIVLMAIAVNEVIEL